MKNENGIELSNWKNRMKREEKGEKEEARKCLPSYHKPRTTITKPEPEPPR
jgi:hypothetical protein